MKKYKLKKWVKLTLISIIILIIGITLIKLNDDYMKGCMNNGYSKDYCIAHR